MFLFYIEMPAIIQTCLKYNKKCEGHSKNVNIYNLEDLEADIAAVSFAKEFETKK